MACRENTSEGEARIGRMADEVFARDPLGRVRALLDVPVEDRGAVKVAVIERMEREYASATERRRQGGNA